MRRQEADGRWSGDLLDVQRTGNRRDGGGEPGHDVRHWKRWNAALEKAVLGGRRTEPDRDEGGSWDPVGIGAAERGRVGTTALATLCMQVYHRHFRVNTDRFRSPK